MKFCKPVQILILAMMAAGPGALATQNPLATVMAGQFDGKSPEIQLEACTEGGQDLSGIHNGNYVLYKNFDFDSGVAGFKARVATRAKGSIEIRFDSLSGPLIGNCPFTNTGGWQNWREVACKVDNSQAGVRDVYLIFHGSTSRALVNLHSFAFLKSIVVSNELITAAWPDRVDTDDNEPQSTASWGVPVTGFTDNFATGNFENWTVHGLRLAAQPDGGYAVESAGTNLNFAFTPYVYINQTDTGGEWRTLAEASLAAEVTLDSPTARPGIGFSSKDGRQWIYVVLNATDNAVEAWRKLADGSTVCIKQFTLDQKAARTLRPGVRYRLQMDWSPFSNGLIVFLRDADGTIIANFRTVIDLPAARRPLLVCSGGASRFGSIHFDPTLDAWAPRWEWKKTPVLTPDVCNPAIWKGKDGRYYMMWRKFGMDTFHGIASSVDGISWQRVNDEILKCRGDMNVLVDPFGDGLVYVTPGGDNMPWWTSDGADQYTHWKNTGLTLGSIFGNSRIQEIVDTKKYPQLKPVRFQGTDYRFIGFTENWTDEPQPHTVVLLSNTLTNWVLTENRPLLPPDSQFWGEKGSAIGSAFVLPDGNILIASCSCTFAGYTGAPEPSNVSAIVDGREPWKVLKLGVLPDAPVSRENVWYEGPNFGTAFYYDPAADTLFFYGGFHDYNIGLMRLRHASQSSLFAQGRTAVAGPTPTTHSN